jgi:hypothetical protein
MQRDRDQCFIQVEAVVIDRRSAIRRPGESYSEVIFGSSNSRRGGGGHEVAAKDDARSDRGAQQMAREWKRLGAPGKSRSECALDERAAPRTGRSFCPAYGARWRSL